MAWIIVEGIDRSGKSSVAELYKDRGYEVYHMSAPDKKYMEPGYTGPSYLDECLELYMHFDGKDVLFDRSIYGEMVWPDIYGRKSQLSSEDIEVLRELEENNDPTYIIMSDPDFDAHWKRCADNNEPLNRNQFNMAVALYDKLTARFLFEKKQLSDYNKDMKEKDTVKEQEATNVEIKKTVDRSNEKSVHQLKLEEANAINTVLSSRIIKKKGTAYDAIEDSVRTHLQGKLSGIFGNNANNTLTSEEIFVFKKYVEQLKKKMESQR